MKKVPTRADVAPPLLCFARRQIATLTFAELSGN